MSLTPKKKSLPVAVIIRRVAAVSLFLSFAAAAAGSWIFASRQTQSQEAEHRAAIHQTLAGVLAPAMSISDFSEVRRVLVLASKPSDFYAVLTTEGDVLLGNYENSSAAPSILARSKKFVSCDNIKSSYAESEISKLQIYCSKILDIGPFGSSGRELGYLVSFGQNTVSDLAFAVMIRTLILALTVIPLVLVILLLVVRRQIVLPLARLHNAIHMTSAEVEAQNVQVKLKNSIGTAPREIVEIGAAFSDLIGRVSSFLKLQSEHETNAAIARTTQMLAHDVRKPFTMLRVGLAMLGKAKDPESVKRVMSRVVPEIDRAMISVDGMLADVMEVGSTSVKLIPEPVSPESLLESTLGDVIRMYPEADISLSYDLNHTHMANVHIQKISRVFSNIVGNSFQAMRYRGSMWFSTFESDGMIRFCIGNDGSWIPEENLPNLFDAFFTSGKKGGTGLGLAIAQKVVTAHSGKIWCESSKTPEHPEGKVEFFFTLPVSNQVNSATANLPKHSSDIAKQLTLLTETNSSLTSMDRGELSLEEDIVAAHLSIGRALRVLIVDDESIYRSALVSHMTRTPELSKALVLTQADSSTGALQAAGDQEYDLIITDVDMGKMSLNGFELVTELRGRGSKALICVHSNRIIAADNKTAIESGADSFIPKPMAHAQLLRLLLQAASAR